MVINIVAVWRGSWLASESSNYVIRTSQTVSEEALLRSQLVLVIGFAIVIVNMVINIVAVWRGSWLASESSNYVIRTSQTVSEEALLRSQLVLVIGFAITILSSTPSPSTTLLSFTSPWYGGVIISPVHRIGRRRCALGPPSVTDRLLQRWQSLHVQATVPGGRTLAVRRNC